MPRALLFLLLAAVCLLAAGTVSAEKVSHNLIPVKADYEQAAPMPAPQVAPDPMSPPPATPAEQMYVFWALGKVISYPVDMIEAYVAGLRDQWQNRAVAVPAAAPGGSNPFDSRHFGQVPPAPPVLNGPADHP